MPDLKIALIQHEQVWEDIDANLELFSTALDGVAPDVDLIIYRKCFPPDSR